MLDQHAGLHLRKYIANYYYFVLKYYNTAVPKTLAVKRTDSVSQTAVKPGRVLPIQWCEDISDFQ